MKGNIELAVTMTMEAVAWIDFDRSHTELETAKLTAPQTNAGPMATNAQNKEKGP
jgi:hypothetical protein